MQCLEKSRGTFPPGGAQDSLSQGSLDPLKAHYISASYSYEERVAIVEASADQPAGNDSS